jgi:hypothetical protein
MNVSDCGRFISNAPELACAEHYVVASNSSAPSMACSLTTMRSFAICITINVLHDIDEA